MSRIGKVPISIPEGVSIKIVDDVVTVAKKDRFLVQNIKPGITVEHDEKANEVRLTRADESKELRSLHGLYRALLANMVTGLATGFQKELEIVGVGYRAEFKEGRLHLQLGYSHPIVFIPPEGIDIVVAKPTSIIVKGYDKEVVGLVSAKIRSFRPPEPYKGKGIKYIDEHIRRKAGKAAG